MRSPRVSSRRLGALIAVLLAVLAGGCSSDGGADDAASGGGSPSAGGSSGSVPAECANVHAGHNAMMWNPVMADEMQAANCGWPYDPFMVTLDGGEDDPELTAEFVATPYAALWTAISGSGVGVCSVGAKIEDEDKGRAFGFDYLVGPPGCPDATPTGSLRVGEFGTEAQRDAAAREAARAGLTTFVLGRWVITVEGEAGTIIESLDGLGAQPLT